MTVLKLNVGDRVRNINKASKRNGLLGIVVSLGGSVCSGESVYVVEFFNGDVQDYLQCNANKYLERLNDRQPPSKLDYGTAYRDASLMTPEGRSTMLRAICDVSGLQRPGKRKVLRRERVNVITGKTQSQMVRELGPARGVVEFNTRATGRSTGQALHAIGSAMTNPGKEIPISGIDHFLESEAHLRELGRVNRHQVDQHFRALVQALVGDMKGFSFTPTHITFNPIVTEEVYVE
ncbi:unknown function [Klebsiella phage vB_Kpn_K22PH164C1]|uniref:Uncharacterized protein n=1 Tax=Klebsiella phage vB_Kpn_K22PH164C1 TaxID=3071617 RepID=A0AAV1MJ75_9CAUD|nr:unknown function [Klebsiella phage vB_Kpn_K22PH164C1]